jgi:hypothetical protein
MRNLNVKPFVYIFVALSGIAWFLISYFEGLDLSKARDFFRILPNVITIDLLVASLFLQWGWKLSIFRDWLVPFPNLNGTWKGQVISDWIVPATGDRLQSIPAALTIKQSFFHLSCVVRTAEMVSHSYAEGFVIEADRQVKWLAYTYTSKPRILLADRSKPHDGTAVLEIIQKPQPRLIGRYWTERKTIGELRFDFHSKQLLEELPADIAQHPATPAGEGAEH